MHIRSLSSHDYVPGTSLIMIYIESEVVVQWKKGMAYAYIYIRTYIHILG